MNRRQFIRNLGLGYASLTAGKSLLFSTQAADAISQASGSSIVKPWGGGPFSGLEWYSGGYGFNAELESLRVGTSKKPGRLDMAQYFSLTGDWAVFKAAPKFWTENYRNHKWLVANKTPAVNLAFRVWPSSEKDKSTNILDRVPSTWPASDKLTDHTWVSPRVPVGWKKGMSFEEGRALAMDVWQKAAEGYFNKKWEEVLIAWRDQYFNTLDRKDLKYVWRPFWEANHTADPGVPHSIGSSSYGCAESDAEIKVVLAGKSEMFKCIKKIFPGSLIHWCPLKKGRTKRDIRLYCPADVDIIGPDYYDTWPASYTEADWAKNSMATGIEGAPVGINRWIEFARERKKMFGIGEWGIGIAEEGDTDTSAGGDNPFFVRKMIETFHANRDILCYEVYFNSKNHFIGGNENPKATAAYRAAFASLT